MLREQGIMDVDAGSGVGNGDSGNSGRHQRIVTLRLAAYQFMALL